MDSQLLKQFSQGRYILCDFCKEKQATITIDTPNNKDVPLCDKCFKKVNVLAGVMKGKGLMNINEIWNEVKDVDNNNWRKKANV